MIRPSLLAALAFVATIPAISSAQTGYGRPSPQQDREERRTTATLNAGVDEGGDADLDSRAGGRPRYADRYGATIEGAREPRNMWRILAQACRRGDRIACERAGEMATRADHDGYADPGYARPDADHPVRYRFATRAATTTRAMPTIRATRRTGNRTSASTTAMMAIPPTRRTVAGRSRVGRGVYV